MQIRECSASARQGAQKLESEISQENVSPPNKSAIEVTGSSSQQEADTAALRKKAPLANGRRLYGKRPNR